MRKILAVVFVLLVLVGLDFGSKSLAESQLRSEAKSKVNNAADVHVDFHGLPRSVSGFPFVVDVLLDGKVRSATLDLNDLTVSPMPVSLLRTDVTDLGLGRGAVLGSSRKITSYGRVVVTVVLTPANISNALSTPVLLRSGYFHGLVKGKVVDGKVGTSGRRIVVTDPNRDPVQIPMPSQDILPCTPSGVSVSPSGMVLSCESKTLPKIIADALGSSSVKQSSGG